MSRTLSKLLSQYESEMKSLVCDSRRCTSLATHTVTWHVLDDCAGGTRVFIMCAECAKETVAKYREQFNKIKPVQCRSCGKRATKLADVCRMERLR